MTHNYFLKFIMKCAPDKTTGRDKHCLKNVRIHKFIMPVFSHIRTEYGYLVCKISKKFNREIESTRKFVHIDFACSGWWHIETCLYLAEDQNNTPAVKGNNNFFEQPSFPANEIKWKNLILIFATWKLSFLLKYAY